MPLGVAVGKIIEFVGVGPIGHKRSIDSFDYVSRWPRQRVNVVAPPSEDWVALFAAWGIPNASRVPIYPQREQPGPPETERGHSSAFQYSGSRLDTRSLLVRALLSFESRQVAVTRVPPVNGLHMGSIHASLSPREAYRRGAFGDSGPSRDRLPGEQCLARCSTTNASSGRSFSAPRAPNGAIEAWPLPRPVPV